MKDIAVVIPTYKAHDTIIRAVSSIAIQTVVDKIQTYLCVDADGEDYTYVKDMFSHHMAIDIIYRDLNGGPGLARQTGIDAGKEPYIMFLDADDTFSGAYAIEKIYQRISSEQSYDLCMVIGTFLEETKQGNYIKHENDMVWMHGKIYKRSFLEKYNIRFNETRSNEDVGFNKIIQFIENPYERIGMVQDLIYYWHWREESIVRKDNQSYNYNESLEGQAINLVYAIRRAVELGLFNERIQKFILESMAHYYILYNQVLYRAPKQEQHALKWITYFYQNAYRLLTKKYIESHELNSISYILAMSGKEMAHVIPKMTYHKFLDKVKQNTKK